MHAINASTPHRMCRWIKLTTVGWRWRCGRAPVQWRCRRCRRSRLTGLTVARVNVNHIVIDCYHLPDTIHNIQLTVTKIISSVLHKRAVAIRLGFVSAQRPASIVQFHVQERNSATEPSRWPGQSYGTVFLQQFVTQTLLYCQNSLFSVLWRCLIFINWPFVMHSRSGLE